MLDGTAQVNGADIDEIQFAVMTNQPIIVAPIFRVDLERWRARFEVGKKFTP